MLSVVTDGSFSGEAIFSSREELVAANPSPPLSGDAHSVSAGHSPWNQTGERVPCYHQASQLLCLAHFGELVCRTTLKLFLQRSQERQELLWSGENKQPREVRNVLGRHCWGHTPSVPSSTAPLLRDFRQGPSAWSRLFTHLRQKSSLGNCQHYSPLWPNPNFWM